MNTPHQQQLISSFSNSLTSGTFVSLTLGNYKGAEENLKNIYIKRIQIKNQEKLSFTYRYKTRDIVKNYGLNEVPDLLESYLKSGFHNASLFTTESDFFLDILPNNKTRLLKKEPSKKEIPAPTHDHNKKQTDYAGPEKLSDGPADYRHRRKSIQKCSGQIPPDQSLC